MWRTTRRIDGRRLDRQRGARSARASRSLGPSVIGDGVTIAPNARIERSILWEGATVGAGATLRDSIVGKEYYVADGTTLDSASSRTTPRHESEVDAPVPP